MSFRERRMNESSSACRSMAETGLRWGWLDGVRAGPGRGGSETSCYVAGDPDGDAAGLGAGAMRRESKTACCCAKSAGSVPVGCGAASLSTSVITRRTPSMSRTHSRACWSSQS